MGAEAWEEHQRAIHDPATVRATLEDYRAGLAAGRRVTCPLLVLWSERDGLGELYPDIPGIWSRWADDGTCGTVDSGHHMAEEAPEQVAGALRAFLAPDRARGARLTSRPRSTPPRPW